MKVQNIKSNVKHIKLFRHIVFPELKNDFSFKFYLILPVIFCEWVAQFNFFQIYIFVNHLYFYDVLTMFQKKKFYRITRETREMLHHAWDQILVQKIIRTSCWFEISFSQGERFCNFSSGCQNGCISIILYIFRKRKRKVKISFLFFIENPCIRVMFILVCKLFDQSFMR